jgi:ABC-type multidrug transport system fused ATPase/permease subunit
MKEEVERKAPQNLGEYLEGTKESLAVFKWIYAHVVTPQSLRYMKWMMVSIVFMIIMQTVQPIAVSYIFNGLAGHNANMTKWGLGIFILALLLQKITQRKYDRTREYVFGLHWEELDKVVTKLFCEKSLAQHSSESSILSPTTIEKGRVKAMDLQRILFFDAFPTLLHLLFSLVFLCILSWVAGLIMFCVICLYIGWSLYLNSQVSRTCTPLDRRFRRLSRKKVERMEHIERVKVSAKEDREVRELASEFSDILKDDRSFWLYFIDVAFARSTVNILGLFLIMVWGAWLVWKGELNIGLLYPLYAWAMRVSENVWRFGDIELQINWNIPTVQSMIKGISLAPSIVDTEDAVEITTPPHLIEFVDVSHTYPVSANEKESPPAIQKVRFTIERGEKVALLGPSGAGKSTIMHKLLRSDDPTEGLIRVNGIDLRNITQGSWKSLIGYIPQKATIFTGTIRYNLTFALSDAQREATTDEELWELMRLLQIDFGDRLTDGLDTLVGKNGIKLSGGQAQRLMIGAAVIKNPQLLIIDEATSSLDSTTEKLVQQGLEAVLANRNTSALIVAHRLSTVRRMCDKFVVLKPMSQVQPGGSQIEAVAHSFEELYGLSPTFRQLADDQGLVIGERELVA